MSPRAVDPVASTALWMAADRARESRREDRLFEDGLADALAGPEGRELMAVMEAGLSDNPALAIRVRYFDDLLSSALSGHIDQVVSLGAGMDTRAFRLGIRADVVYFELDHPELVALKHRRLVAAAARPTCERRAVPTDLSLAWSTDLLAAGFDPARAVVFVAEGLLGYLTAPQVHGFLDELTGLAAEGSVLLADVSGPAPPDPELETWLARRREAGMAQRFSTDQPGALLRSHGWDAVVVEYGESEANFGRWPWPVDRHDPSLPHSYLMSARLGG